LSEEKVFEITEKIMLRVEGDPNQKQNSSLDLENIDQGELKIILFTI
jgi:hypothetical protein